MQSNLLLRAALTFTTSTRAHYLPRVSSARPTSTSSSTTMGGFKLTVDHLLQRSKDQAAKHAPIPYFSELAAAKAERPHILIISCLDPRVFPETIFQLNEGEAGVIRNAGGRVKPALNDIIALDAWGHITDVLIVHHTDCGTTHFTNTSVRAEMMRRLPNHEEIKSMEFGEILDLEQSVKDDLHFAKASKYLRKELADNVRGYLYDIKTGELKEIKSN